MSSPLNLHIEVSLHDPGNSKTKELVTFYFNNLKFLTTWLHPFLTYKIANPSSIVNLNSRACLCLVEGENNHNVFLESYGYKNSRLCGTTSSVSLMYIRYTFHAS